MPGITVRDGQPIDLILKLLKKQVEKAGTIGELKRRSFYEKPSIRRKKKSAMARKRLFDALLVRDDGIRAETGQRVLTAVSLYVQAEDREVARAHLALVYKDFEIHSLELAPLWTRLAQAIFRR